MSAKCYYVYKSVPDCIGTKCLCVRKFIGTLSEFQEFLEETVQSHNQFLQETDVQYLCRNKSGDRFESQDGTSMFGSSRWIDGSDSVVDRNAVNDKRMKQIQELQEENQKLRTYAIQMLDVLSGVNLGYHYGAQELYEEVSGFLGRWE